MDGKLVALGLGAAAVGYLVGRSSKPSETKVATSDEQKCPRHKWRGNLKEYSVVYTDRAVNLMSQPFQKVMREISSTLKEVYHADGCALIPGSGTYAMEAVARQFGKGEKCMVLRNGFFSFRWSEIFDRCKIPSEEIVIKARAIDKSAKPAFAPCPIEEVVANILAQRPAVVFAPHIETSTGIILPDDYLRAVADATHQVGGLFVLDCIASGTIWVDMKALGLDVVISAPQKGWSGPACVGIVMVNETAKKRIAETDAQSFVVDLKKWLQVMEKYEAGGFMYYTTLPTDSLSAFCVAMKETKAYGFQKANDDLWKLGSKVREVLASKGFPSVAAKGFEAPGVVVSYADDNNKVADFKKQNLQIAGGVPFKIDEPAGLMTFRLGLFGLDKIANIYKAVGIFEEALDNIVRS